MYHEIIHNVLYILKQCRNDLTNDDAWKSLLNESNLQHKVEESIVALHYLRQCIITRHHLLEALRNFMVVDVCWGKGVFSVILCYLTTMHRHLLSSLTRIILLDKDSNTDCSPIKAANNNNSSTNRKLNDTTTTTRPVIEVWSRMNLHDYDSKIVPRLQSYNQHMAMTGIHLCKTLGPSFVSLMNVLGTKQAPYLCLAPCSLPCLQAKISITNYESPLQRNMRLKMMQQHMASQDPC